eukprot:2864424-Pleurochrysis_carterae.AAC.1
MAQAGRRWQRSLFPWLLDFGFTQCVSDPCVFTMTKRIDGTLQRLVLGCYVDDLFTLYTHDGPTSLYAEFVDALTTRWNVEDEGPVSDLLNVDITVTEDSVILKQEKYIAHLVWGVNVVHEGNHPKEHTAQKPEPRSPPLSLAYQHRG